MITCRIHQRMVSSCLDSNAELPAWTRNHLHNCPACRQYYQATVALAQEMSTAADEHRQSATPFLHHKIMTAVQAPEHAAEYSGRAWLGWALVLGTACLVAAAVVWWRQSPATDPIASQSTAPTAQPGLTMDLPSLTQVDQWTKNLDSPLEQETKLVLSDANSALKTLANGFLPEELLRSPADSVQR
jgi:predicted anti-sigma-YlaC factor YlaD